MDSLSMNQHQHQHFHQGDYGKGVTNSSSSFSVWNKFFLLAGIPHAVAHEYAETFSQHRIRIDMLKEITKDILIDIGIKAMGDIIAILKHAKDLYTQEELKGSLFKPANPATEIAATSSMMSSHSNSVSQAAKRAPITTTRQAVSTTKAISSPYNLNVSGHSTITAAASTTTTPQPTSTTRPKTIQSRLNLNSGALLASSSNHSASPHQVFLDTNTNNKRLSSSTLSASMAKRIRPAAESNREIIKNLPEKTLTVHYPPSSAIVKAQQRISSSSNNTSSGRTTGTSSNNPTSTLTLSVKSRLGQLPSDNSRSIRSDTSNNNNDNNSKKNWNRAYNDGGSASRSASKHSSSSSGHRNSRPANRLEQGSKHHHYNNSSKREKSTVFKRLGDGAR